MATKTVKKVSAAKVDAVEPADEVASAPVAKSAKVIIPKDIDPHQVITVRNGFQGTLIYRSSKTGERFVWNEFGDEQDMELSELRNAKGANKDFFINNWFMFDEPWVVDYLGMAKFYKNAVSIEEFDNLFDKDPVELEAIINSMSDGQKKSVGYRARILIGEKKIDSMKVIDVVEKVLGIQLIER